MFFLGKHKPKLDDRTLQLANYIGGLPVPPVTENWGKKVSSWSMYANDAIGDCTFAAAGHMIKCWSANAGKAITPTTKAIVAGYSALTGYNGTPATDRGANELDVMNFWRKTGIGGHQIGAYAQLTPKNVGHIRISTDLFGGVYIGLAMPKSAQTQSVWSVPTGGPVGSGAPGSWGGHAVNIIEYDAKYLTCVTWGATLKMTWGFWNTYCDEAYAILSTDWLQGKQMAPCGFDFTALQTDLGLVIS
jgi:hypothetical protein